MGFDDVGEFVSNLSEKTIQYWLKYRYCFMLDFSEYTLGELKEILCLYITCDPTVFKEDQMQLF